MTEAPVLPSPEMSFADFSRLWLSEPYRENPLMVVVQPALIFWGRAGLILGFSLGQFLLVMVHRPSPGDTAVGQFLKTEQGQEIARFPATGRYLIGAVAEGTQESPVMILGALIRSLQAESPQEVWAGEPQGCYGAYKALPVVVEFRPLLGNLVRDGYGALEEWPRAKNREGRKKVVVLLGAMLLNLETLYPLFIGVDPAGLYANLTLRLIYSFSLHYMELSAQLAQEEEVPFLQKEIEAEA